MFERAPTGIFSLEQALAFEGTRGCLYLQVFVLTLKVLKLGSLSTNISTDLPSGSKNPLLINLALVKDGGIMTRIAT